MTARERLANRRECETFSFRCDPFHYVATIGLFPDGTPAEIFISNGKAGSASDTAAKDAVVICSIALQHGVPLERHSARTLARPPRHGVIAARDCTQSASGGLADGMGPAQTHKE